MYGFSRYAQLQDTANTSCWHKAFVLYMMWWELPNGQWQTMPCHCQVAEFLLHKKKLLIRGPGSRWGHFKRNREEPNSSKAMFLAGAQYCSCALLYMQYLSVVGSLS
jgi:hypothetical protein